MRSAPTRDYYDVLGVSDAAGNTEIRIAFRGLARRYHPDVAEDKPQAEERFKEINAAYQVLSDSEKRSDYKNRRISFLQGSEHRQHANQRSNPVRSERNAWDPVEPRSDRQSDLPDYFEWMSGLESNPVTQVHVQDPAADSKEAGAFSNESDMEILLSLEEAAQGVVRDIWCYQTVSCGSCSGSGRVDWHGCHGCDGSGRVIESAQYRVRIPAGVLQGCRLPLVEFGERLGGNGEVEDVHLRIRWSRHPLFRVERGTLHCDVSLSFRQAALGAVVSVPTLTGRVEVRVPPCVCEGQKLKLPGCGLPGVDGTKGDLYAVIRLPI
jgi:curved DNA-binding protein